ncbi:hypothetical protein HXA31_20555 [Salipaludibacillus agaradhaerens]|jgi:Flp pilus assembly protein TadB|uniref:Transmembrane Fragile-X-F protein n=1 Tax=Salipaludibacillus agaradhaerens TaxID=76935 RepID=A0A9Q4B2Q2_SALAG|nr:hypothetical protein [Salipaludibacillus agaradhaerens]MCR6096880.1 hypothetical protein [Salipaludibacillus agaradhaerens]MCR6116724.1 hypothetical protein [Salipaludibacillus agaradhaerens]
MSNTSSGGIGFTGLLTVLFIALKLTGVINWSWVWVLSPIWISFSIFILVFVVVLLIAALMDIKKEKRIRKMGRR